jgi:hypothetical protein
VIFQAAQDVRKVVSFGLHRVGTLQGSQTLVEHGHAVGPSTNEPGVQPRHIFVRPDQILDGRERKLGKPLMDTLWQRPIL